MSRVETPENVAPTADHFKEIVALAKYEEQEIKLGPTMRPEFKAALIEACAKGGVEIHNLSNEDREIYNSFKPKEESEQREQEGDKNFLHGGYDGYLSPESAKIRYNMMERLSKTPAKDAQFNDVKDSIIDPIEILNYPKISVNEDEFERISHGNPIHNKNEISDGQVVILIYDDIIISVGKADGKKILIKKVFR